MNNTTKNCTEFSVQVRGESLKCLLAEPNRLSNRPALLLNFALDRTTTLQTKPYDITPRMFVAAEHRAVSSDLPCHGERAISGQLKGIAGFYAEWTSGRDVPSGRPSGATTTELERNAGPVSLKP